MSDLLRLLENEVRGQQAITRDVVHRLGGKITVESRLKQGAAWFAEKVGRLKLNDSFLTYSELSRVVELETLAAAAQERIALWDNLDALTSHHARLEGISCGHFRDQSQRHLAELQSHRRFAAIEAFRGSAEGETGS